MQLSQHIHGHIMSSAYVKRTLGSLLSSTLYFLNIAVRSWNNTAIWNNTYPLLVLTCDYSCGLKWQVGGQMNNCVCKAAEIKIHTK